MNRPGFLLYRCRSCGAVEPNPHVPDVTLALVYASAGDRFPVAWGGTAGLVSLHYCGPGRAGVSDLIGSAADDPEPRREP